MIGPRRSPLMPTPERAMIRGLSDAPFPAPAMPYVSPTSPERIERIRGLAFGAVSHTSGRNEYVTLLAEILAIAVGDGLDAEELSRDALAELLAR